MVYVAAAIGLILVALAIWYLIRYLFPSGHLRIFHLRLRDDGLEDIPAIPFTLRHLISSLVKLGLRSAQTKDAKQGLSNTYTIGGHTENGYTFLYGESKADHEQDSAAAAAEAAREDLKSEYKRKGGLSELRIHGFTKRIRERIASARFEAEANDVNDIQRLSLEQPEQFAISWTTLGNVDKRSEPLKEPWAKAMKDVEAATNEFWPNIAVYGTAFNLLIAQKLTPKTAESHKSADGVWTEEHDRLLSQGALYVIDMSVFESVEPHVVKGRTRFTPATVVYLSQDAVSKQLRPFSVVVSGSKGAGRKVFEKEKVSSSSWLYALLAARASISVWGIWLGHVYHWHIVTAAMQMTMHNTFDEDHAIFTLVGPQSEYLITFDVILLLLWKHVAPPTSINSGVEFLQLTNTFAGGRTFFDDDPRATLSRFNISESDFTTDGGTPWDAYPTVANLLYVWDATEMYVSTFVDEHYADDAAVHNDHSLQKWFSESADSDEGNINFGSGFTMNGKTPLTQVLTSLIYRITVHGCSRMNASANPSLSFVANLPPCLQKDDIPNVDVELNTTELLEYLPNTGTIGEMVTFLFTFVYSAPYRPFIPVGGDNADLFFNQSKYPKSNAALIEFRKAVREFIPQYSADSPLIHQWPMNIET